MPVAVLIVNYRTYDALDRCLTSLRPSVAAGDEVAVVDWVTDDEQRMRLEARHESVTWLPSRENLGFSTGINRAAAATTAPVLLLLNPDAELEGPVMRELEGWLSTHDRTAVAGPRVLNIDGTVQASARRFPGFSTLLGGRSTWLSRRFPNNWFSRRNLLQRSARDPAEVDWVAGSCFATRRDVFERLGGFDEAFFMYWEDADYCRRAGALGYACHYVPSSIVRHSGGASSAYNVEPSIRAFHRSAFRLYWKHAGIGRLLAPVVWIALWARAQVKVAWR